MGPDNSEDSDEQHDAVLDRIETLSSGFVDSLHFGQLPRHQQREVPFVIKSTGELLYGYEDMTFEECDERSLENVYTRIYRWNRPGASGLDPDAVHHYGP